MALRVSLQLDGDADGLKKSTQESQQAIVDLGKTADGAAGVIADSFNSAAAAAEKLANKGQELKAANDNTAASAAALVSQIGSIATQAAGADSAIGKLANGASGVAKGIIDVVQAAGSIGLISAGINIAVVAATTFYSLIISRSGEAQKNLQEQARLVGVVRDAYRDATATAGDFLQQSKAIVELQARQNLLAIQADLRKSSREVLSTFGPGFTNGGGFIPGNTSFGGEFNIVPPGQTTDEFKPFQAAIEKLQASIAAGTPDLTRYRDEVAAIGLAARGANPAVAEQAAKLLEQSQAAGDLAFKAAQLEATLRLLAGAATDADRKLLGITVTAKDTSNEFDRLIKSLQRQSAAQEAEAQAVGKSVGEAARLRAEFILLEAAQQAGIKVQGEYADKVKTISDRFGAAAQKVAEFRLKSDAAFERSQLGRDNTEGAVAAKLRDVYGDNFESQLNGSAAASLRLNEQLRQAKDGATDFLSTLAQGAAAGQKPIDALTAALGRLQARMIDFIVNTVTSSGFKQLSSFFGGVPGGSTQNQGAGLSASAVNPSPYDVGGYTGDGSTSGIAGVVHGQEFVVRASQTARFRPLLQAINDNRFPGYADGGYVGGGRAAWPSQPAGDGGDRLTINVINQNGSQVSAKKKGRDQQGNMVAEVFVKDVVKGGLAQGEFGPAMNARQRAPTRTVGRV